MTNYSEMGKVELRAACKAAGIPYGKLNNDGMRAALVAGELNDQGPVANNEPVVSQLQPVKADAHTGTGVRIEKERVTQNGVTRPSVGGKCRAIWDELDRFTAENDNQPPTIAMVRDLAVEEGWNLSNATIEFYQWRKFNGIVGRSK